ncbi:hypothetical protein C491_08328 [Natronococcus amylolyticus DSM 10524]|uniref:Uncharacterized protein n=1 Tax=Natronococcus amylolyticus DSM 10524 TaxID=1227497 RepID=L9XAZ3_9EURY|nr:hypothetical protein [Natronococcus amylolyticus]ELY58812.1 hypothetical protein C491_08328 [Natronococcus amylolyticus DSM 10524]
MPTIEHSPDHIAHKLVTNTGSPARIYLAGETLTVPTKPYRSGTPPTIELSVSHLDAVIERADVVDGGHNVAGFGGLHIPASEWERTGLGRHWNADGAAVGEPFSNTARRLEVWASREDALYESERDDWSFDHLEPVPETSPLVREWEPLANDGPDRPPVPLSTPELVLSVLHAEDAASRTSGFDRLEVGRIDGIEILDELEVWPTEPEVETVDIDPSPRHPRVDYDALDPLPQTDDVLAVVHAINRHAKRFDTEADRAYRIGDGARARVYSLKKKALYRTKTVAVHRLVKMDPERTRVARHDLNGVDEMYCFYFGDEYSFHQPIPAVADELLDDIAADDLETTAIDFEPSAEMQDLEYSLDEALCFLASHRLDATDYLDATAVEDYDRGVELSTTFDCLETDNPTDSSHSDR